MDEPDILRVVAPAEAEGERADRFLAGTIGTLSRTRVKGLIEAGHVLRDGAVIGEPAQPVRAGAAYEVRVPAAVSAMPLAQAIPFEILYEDADLLVLDKPAGLVVHPAPGNEDGTLVNALLAHCGDSLPGIGGERRPGIVHRLDRDTSGVMVVAKTATALAALSAMFAARDLERAYVALAWGVPNPAAGEIEGAIGRDPRDRKRMAILGARWAGGTDALPHPARIRRQCQPAGVPAGNGAHAPDPGAFGQSGSSGSRGSCVFATHTGGEPGAAAGGAAGAAGFSSAGAACADFRVSPSANRGGVAVRDRAAAGFSRVGGSAGTDLSYGRICA
jgi:RluA family pseudouridine synthase